MTDTQRTETDESTSTPVRGTGWIATKVPLVITIALAIVLHREMSDMTVGSLTEPGPGFWPRLLIVGIVLVSLAGFVVDLREGVEPFEAHGLARVLAGFASLVVFTLLFESTGTILAGIIFLMIWLKGLNGESWRLSITIAVIAPVLSYLLFVDALGVRFPDDLIASLWGGR